MEYNIWPWCYAKNTNNYRLIAFWIHISFWKIVRRLCSAVTANSPSIRSDIVSWGTSPDRVFLLPTGIEIVASKNKSECDLRENFVLYAGRLVEERGADQISQIIEFSL